MANIIKRVYGNDLLQEDLPNHNFVVSHQGGLEFNPVSPDDSELPTGLAYSTFHPLEGNVTWIKAEARWTYSNPATPPAQADAQAIISLMGLMPDGSEHLIGESVNTFLFGTNSTPAQQVSFFDLKASGGQPPLYLESATGGTAGYVRLHLPFRVQNIENCDMYKTWMDASYTNRNMHSLIHPRTFGSGGAVVGPLYIQTTPGMDDLQRDVSFADSDGKTGLCFYRDPVTLSTPGTLTGWNGFAQYHIKIPYIGPFNSWKYIYSYYGGQGASPTDYSNGHNTFFSFDDWEDGLYTGRTAPYTNWTAVTGTASIQTVTPITGSKTLKITGPGVGTSDAQIGLWKYLYLWPYEVEFDYRVSTNASGNVGTDTYTPYIGIWYFQYKDANNFVRFDTYYDSGNGNQWLRLCKWQGGVFTEYQKTSAGGRHGAGTGARIKVLDDWNGHVQVWWNNQIVIDTYYTINWDATYKYGFGAMRDSAGNWDNFKFYQPWAIGADHNFNTPREVWGNAYCSVIMEDNFDDNSLDANKWVAKLGTGASTPVETNQELRVSGTGTYRSSLMTKYAFRAPYTVMVDAKKSENIEITVDWGWGGVNNSYFGGPDTGYCFRYASWQNPTRFEIISYNPTSPYTTLLGYANYTLDSNYHTYRIERSEKAINVSMDDTWIMGVYAGNMINSVGFRGGYVGLSARETPAAVNAYYNNFKVGGNLRSQDLNVPVTPASYTGPSIYLNYTTPTGAFQWTDGTPWHFRMKENQSGEYKTGDMIVSAKNVLKLGFDNVDKYVALRLKVEWQGRSDTPFTLDYIDYHYNLE